MSTKFCCFIFSCCTLYVLGFTPSVNAEFHGNLTATTDYIWRGYSKTSGEFALHANLDYEHSSGWYLGTSVSNVNFADRQFNKRSSVEIVPYLGWTYNITDDWRLDLQWSRYLYDGNIYGNDSDYNEFYFLLNYKDLLTGRISFSDNYYNQDHMAADYAVTGRYPLTQSLDFSAAVGYSQIKKVLEYDYVYWELGLTYYYEMVALDLRYHDARHTSDDFVTKWPYDPEIINNQFVFSISIGF